MAHLAHSGIYLAATFESEARSESKVICITIKLGILKKSAADFDYLEANGLKIISFFPPF